MRREADPAALQRRRRLLPPPLIRPLLSLAGLAAALRFCVPLRRSLPAHLPSPGRLAAAVEPKIVAAGPRALQARAWGWCEVRPALGPHRQDPSCEFAATSTLQDKQYNRGPDKPHRKRGSNSLPLPDGTSLKGSLQAADDASRVISLMQQYGGECTVYDWNDAFACMKRLRGIKAFQQLVPMAFKRLPDFDAILCATVASVAAHFNTPLTAEQQAAWEARTAQLLPKAGSQAVGNIAWALGKLRRQPQAAMAAVFRQAALRALLCADLEHAAATGQPVTKPQHVSNSLWGFSRLGWSLDDSTANAAVAAIKRTAGSMKPQEASNVIWAVGNGLQLPGDMGPLLRPLLLLALVTGNPQNVANSLWGWSKLGLALDDEAAKAAVAAIKRCAGSMISQHASNVICALGNGLRLPGDMGPLLRPLLLLALVTGNPQNVANSLWGWSKLGLALDDEAAKAAVAAIKRTAGSMKP